MGLQGQGHPGRSGRSDRVQRQLSRTFDHDCRLLLRDAVSRRLRSVPGRIQASAVWRRRRARAGDWPPYRGVPGRADPGRRRHRRSAGGLSRGLRAHLPRAQRAFDMRRNPDRHGPHRNVSRMPARQREARWRHPRQSAGGRPVAGVGDGRHGKPDASLHAGRSRKHIRRQSAGGGGGPGRARRALR